MTVSIRKVTRAQRRGPRVIRELRVVINNLDAESVKLFLTIGTQCVRVASSAPIHEDSNFSNSYSVAGA